MEKYNLVGVDGNAYAIMGYVVKSMREQKFTLEEIEEYKKKAMASDYNNLLAVSIDYIEECNNRAEHTNSKQ